MTKLQQRFLNFTSGMFGFFSVGMLIGADRMFGPSSPKGLMVYWLKDGGPMADWWAVNCAAASLAIILGPFCLGVSNAVAIKQWLVCNSILTCNMMYAFLNMAEADTMMWKLQLPLQLAIMAVNLYLVFGNKLSFKGAAKRR